MSEMLPDDSVPRSILILVFLLLSAFFAAAETAFSTTNKIRMKLKAEEGNKAAARVLYIVENYDKTLSTILIGVNVANTAASVLATSLAVSIWGPVGPLIVSIGLTVIIFLFFETIPKNIGKANSDLLATYFSVPIRALLFLLTPFTWFFSALGNLVKKLFLKGDDGPSLTEEEFQAIIENIEEEGLIEREESELIKSAVVFSDTTAESIMVPLSETVAIEINESPEEVREKLLSVKYSRLPVYLGTPEKIVGILHSKDYLLDILNGNPKKLKAAITPPYYIPPDMKLDALFEGLGKRRTHMAIVTDKLGRAQGIVTMEDVLEEIFGEIYDEDDRPAEVPPRKEGPKC